MWHNPHFKKAAESVILPSDHRILCDCGSDQPMASVVMLRSYALRGGRLVSEVTGERVSCQSCGNLFSIGPHGRFKHHPQALPWSPQALPQQNAAIPPQREQPEEPRRAPILPIPLRAPRV